MEINNIVEICIGIDIAILGIAYPIIIDKISNIGDKYSSLYLSEIFNKEFPQKSISINFFKVEKKLSVFQLTLFITITTFLFQIFQLEPLFNWNNWFINNSADLLLFTSTFFLTVFFFAWLGKISLYNGKSDKILKHIITKYNSTKNSNHGPYYLKAINEFTYYSVDKQDEHLQEQLVEFYYNEFAQIRREHQVSEPLVYPVDLYFMVHKLIVQLANNENRKLPVLEHRAVSGWWFLGEDLEEIPISEETYSWLWRNLYEICDTKKYIKQYWSTAFQYFSYRLRRFDPEYDFGSGIIKHHEFEERRENERHKFLEFNFALGGLLLYRKQYESLKYLFQYSQSEPPSFVLLPNTMTEIFNWFENFRNEFKNRSTPIDITYFFPELDNLGNRRQVIYWICSYISLLFIRQYTLNKYYTYQDFTAQPNLPKEVGELNNWLDGISFFEKCSTDVITNNELLSTLNYNKIVSEKEADIKGFPGTLKDNIIAKIGDVKYKAPLSDEKIQNFKDKSNEIITKTFEQYDSIFTSFSKEDIDDVLKLDINGGTTLMSKSAFTEGDIPTLYYDSVFAEQLSKHKLERFIPGTLSSARTRRYLFNHENIKEVLTILVGKNQNIIIIAINRNLKLKTSLKEFDDKIIDIPSTQQNIYNSFYVLSKNDLPSIVHNKIDEKEQKNKSLDLVNDKLFIYTSVIDINIPENEKFKSIWNSENFKDNMDLKVQISIIFSATILWKKDRDIIQINIADQYKEQGLQNEIKDLRTLKNNENASG